MDKTTSSLEKVKKELTNKIEEYEYVEKHFDTDKSGNIKYDEEKDNEFSMNNASSEKTYIGVLSFLDWVDNKTKKELQNELAEINQKIEKCKETKKKLTPSKEQSIIVEHITNNKNVVVDAVAGSGKTTTTLYTAKSNVDKKILQITYNKALKLEVRDKVIKENLNNIEIHTYHSLAVKFYDSTAHTDDKIIKILQTNTKPKTTKHYDILIIDEVQDATPNYFSLILKFITDLGLKKSTLLILGDRFQSLYEFKNADVRFLTLASKIWPDRTFMSATLSESYRVTTQMASFINKVMLGQHRIVANKKGKYKVQYYRTKRFWIHKTFSDRISLLLKEGYKPNDIFVLAPSLKSTNNNPIKKLENSLVQKNIPVYFSRSDDEGLNEDIIQSKIVFSTFHQAKGRERKVVICFGFDKAYFTYHAKEKDPYEPASELYVACTRASEILIIFEDEDSELLPFLKCGHKEMISSGLVDFFGNSKIEEKKEKKEVVVLNEMHETSVTELTKYIDEEKSNTLIPIINQLYVTKKEARSKYTVDIPSSLKMDNGLTEDVSNLNGLVIPAMYQTKQSKEASSLEQIINFMYNSSDNQTKKFIDKKKPELEKYVQKNPIAYYLCLGALYITLGEKIYSKLKQIDRYDWLTKDMVSVCNKNLAKNIGDNAQYEQDLGQYEDNDGKYFQYVTNSYGNINIKGRVDCYDDDILWEFKCVSSLQIEHKLQLIVYAWIWNKCMQDKHGSKRFKLLNIRTGEVQELKYESYLVEEVMDILFANKYKSKVKDDDKEFIEKCNKTALAFSQKETAGKNIFIFTDNTSDKKQQQSDDESETNTTEEITLNTSMFGGKSKVNTENVEKKPTKKNKSK